MSTLAKELEEKICAGFSGIYLQSAEHDDALEDIRRMCSSQGWITAMWDMETGMMTHEPGSNRWVQLSAGNGKMTAAAAVVALPTLNEGLVDGDGVPVVAVLVLKNAHRFLDGPLFQLVINQIAAGKLKRQVLIFLSPILKLPAEYEAMKLFDIVEHKLPDSKQLLEIAEGIAVNPGEMPPEEKTETLLDAGAGFTRLGFENACSLSIIRHGKLLPHEILTLKQQSLKNVQGLTLHYGKETFADIGGLDFMKTYCMQTLGRHEKNPKFRNRGILIMGVSGGGKSLFCKALGNEVDRPVLHFDVGSTMGSLLGQSQSQFRKALAMADAMAPCVLFLDELEKSLSGVQGSSRTDGGVKAEMFGYFLTWLQDHESDVFVAASCNDVRKLSDDNPELIRRFDNLFFVDFPGRVSKDAIWKIHLKGYELWDGESDFSAIELPDDGEWTGAEIEMCARQARLRGLQVAEVGKHMPKIADQARDTITAAREWACRRCYSAEHEGLYVPESANSPVDAQVSGKPRRAFGKVKT